MGGDHRGVHEDFNRAVTSFLEGAHEIAPHRLASLIAEAASTLGARRCRVWLADHQLRRLVHLTDGDAADPLVIDGSAAGRAFLTGEVVDAEHATGGRHVWSPLVDGVDRIGVLELEVDALPPALRQAIWHLSSVAAAEVLTRGQYTDLFTVTRRERPMSLAAELQWQGLPPHTFSTDGVVISGMLEPAYEASGDAYDYAHAEGRLSFAVFDAVGHDLTSSLVSTLAVGAYRNERRAGTDLAATGRAIDDAIAGVLGRSLYATGQLATLDTSTGELRWLNAGHPRPLLIRDRRVVGSLRCRPRLPFGLGHLQARRPDVAVERLQPGDSVLLYTDGIVEARRAGGSDFGEDRLREFLGAAFAAGSSPSETVRRLSNAVLDYHGGHLQDDATTVLVTWDPGHQPSR